MYGKVIFSLALLAFVCVQLAASLTCFTCNDATSCKAPGTVKCTQTAANATRDILTTHYNGVKSLNTKDFHCFAGGAYYRNVTTMAVRGCIMKGAIECSYSLRNQNHTKTSCTICNKDKCNKSNSVGTISSSILTVISLAALAKVFVM